MSETRTATSEAMHESIVQNLPHLRAFALLLTRERTLADDLVQEAVVRALTHANQFQQGTNFKAWITTILRNSYFNEIRHRGRVSQLSVGAPREEPTTSGGQEEQLDMRDFERAFKTLTGVQREALLLVGASGFSYEDAAQVAGCAVGTMKSRVSRARIQLQEMLDGNAAMPAIGSESPVDATPPRPAVVEALRPAAAWAPPLKRTGTY